MASSSTMSQEITGATALPTGVLKRKAATEVDMFKPAKRTRNTASHSTFAEEWQKDLQRARDQVLIRPDQLEGVIVPPKALPQAVHSKWGGKTAFDEEKTRKWASLHASKTRVKKNTHVSEAVRARALASFPKVEARNKEEQQEKARARDLLLEGVTGRIERFRRFIEGARKNPDDSKRDVPRCEFLHQCWKNLNYAVRFQHGPLEHQDLRSYAEEFNRTWATRQNKLWRPQWRKDKRRDCLAVEWVYHRV